MEVLVRECAREAGDRPGSRALTTSSALALVALAVAALPGYLAVAFVLPSTPSWMEQPAAALVERLPLWTGVQALTSRAGSGLTTWAIFWSMVLSLIAYAVALRQTRGLGDDLRAGVIVAGVAAALSLTAVLGLPNLDTDVYLYTLYARVVAVHGSNPYMVVPANFLDDPFVSLTPWIYVTSLYGPAWIFVSLLVERMAGDDPVRALFAFRLTLFGCGFVTLPVIWHIAGQVNPRYRVAGLVAWGWNPIVVMYGPQKLDTFLTLLVLLGILAWVEQRRSLSLVALTAATLTKVVAAPLLAVCLLAITLRPGARVLLLSMGFLVAIGALAVLPVSIYTPRRILFLPGLLAVVLIAGRMAVNPRRLIVGLVAVQLYAYVFLTPGSKPWYLLPLIGLVGVTDSSRVTSAVVVVCASALVFALLLLLPDIGTNNFLILWGLSMIPQCAALIWACTPLLARAREQGLAFRAGGGFSRHRSVLESAP
jgi:hypothetical protein